MIITASGHPCFVQASPEKSTSKSNVSHNTKSDISFSGDQARKKNDTYILDGNVTLEQDKTTLKSNKAYLYYAQTKSSDTSMKLERAIAKGNVRISKIISEDNTKFNATCNEVELLPEKKLLILTGNAKVWRDDEFVHAKVITINTETGDLNFDDPRGTFASQKMGQPGL